MKKFKKADLAFQIALVMSFTILTICGVVNILTSYYVVGSIQVLSMIIHAANNRNTRKGSKRYYYHRITSVTILALAIASFTHHLFFIKFALLFAAPCMAVYYTWICYFEIIHAAKRPLELI